MSDNIERKTEALRKTRYDRVKELGLYCYNERHTVPFPVNAETTAQIDRLLQYLPSDSDETVPVFESEVEDAVVRLGCDCYNLYMDRKLPPHRLFQLCEQIEALNRMIERGQTDDTEDDTTLPPHRAVLGEDASEPPHYAVPEPEASASKDQNMLPAGMERIPVDFRRCLCGYKNRSYARYCGKCGEKL